MVEAMPCDQCTNFPNSLKTAFFRASMERDYPSGERTVPDQSFLAPSFVPHAVHPFHGNFKTDDTHPSHNLENLCFGCGNAICFRFLRNFANMGSGPSMISMAQLEFQGPPDYWVTPQWLCHTNKDGEFRPSVGLLEKLWRHKVVVNLIKSEHNVIWNA